MKSRHENSIDAIKPKKLKTFTLVFFLFLVINFLGLFLGGLFTNQAVTAEWYLSLNKSPITPPGWFFGFAWTSIMICLAVYMALAYKLVSNKSKLITIFAIQWILNFLWNPLFFYFHQVIMGLIVIVSLTLLIIFFVVSYYQELKWKSVLLLPYAIWLCVASWLNFYIFINN